MTDKSLKDKAIDIKGKKYVLVSNRVIYFNEKYPTGSITTELVSDTESDQVIIKATVEPIVDNPQRFTGYSQAIKGDGMVNKTAALENAETSAVGRALAMMGIGVLDSIASADEMNKAQGSSGQRKLASEKQIAWLRKAAERITGQEDGESLDSWIKLVTGLAPQETLSANVFTAVKKLETDGVELEKADQTQLIGSKIDLDKEGIDY